jgi:hypothetical protein
MRRIPVPAARAAMIAAAFSASLSSSRRRPSLDAIGLGPAGPRGVNEGLPDRLEPGQRAILVHAHKTAIAGRHPPPVPLPVASPRVRRRSKADFSRHGRPPRCCYRLDRARRLRSRPASIDPRARPAHRCRSRPLLERLHGKHRPRPCFWPQRPCAVLWSVDGTDQSRSSTPYPIPSVPVLSGNCIARRIPSAPKAGRCSFELAGSP